MNQLFSSADQSFHIQHRTKQSKQPKTYRLSMILLASLVVTALISFPSSQRKQASATQNLRTTAQAGSGKVSGNAFADYNADGVDAGPNEHGVQGIRVQAYDVDNNPFGGPIVTDANGDYTISDLASGQQIRIEFSLPPELDFLRPGAADSSSSAIGSSTTVTFATEGDLDVNVGFNNPADYCQANPDVAISCFVFGPDDGPNAADAAMVSIPFEAEGGEQDQTTKLNAHQDVGTVYGIAYQKSTKQLYAAAYLKRFTDFGPGGPDAIYQVDLSGAIIGTISLAELAGTTNVAGDDPHDFTPDPNSGDLRDDASYGLIGKSSLGDIELSDDMTTLYVVNMFDRKIYAIDVSSGDVNTVTPTNSWDAPDACESSEHRPMGLAWHNEKLWIGSVCEDISGGYVHSLDPVDGTFELAITIPLDYAREQVLNVPDLSSDTLATWNPWSDDPALFDYSFINEFRGEYEITYPQPMLSDIEFDGPHMILGFRDRFGDQAGYEALQIPAGSGTTETPDDRLYDADAVGDILRVCHKGNGGWVLETGVNGDCSPVAGAIGPQPDSGPNGQEYYYWDNYPAKNAGSWTPNENIEHYETSQGSLLQVQGSPSIMLTAMDPFRSYSAGILRLDNLTGQRVGISADDQVEADELAAGGYELYNVTDQPSTFGKANGLGDLEAICELAPVEIGNYVWLDADGDGIQDPGETGIPSVTVELYQDGILVGQTTTNEEGGYLFGGLADLGMTDGTLLPNTSYHIRIPLDDAALPANALPTNQDYNGDTDNGDLHDADGDNGTLNPNFSTIEITTGGPGENDHTFDFGFTQEVPEPGIQLDKTVYIGHDGGENCPGAELANGAVGGDVTYCFVVTNTGGTYLTEVTLSDDTLGITRTDMTQISGEEPLAPNATLTFYYETTITGPLVNTANTTGTPSDSEGNPIPGLEKLTDEDDAEVRTPGPDIEIDKTVYLGHDDGVSCPAENLVTGAVDGDVTYCFVITNTGDTHLNDIEVNDDTLRITRMDMTQTSGTEPLAPGEVLTFYYETTIAGPLVNTAKTTGTPTDSEGNEILGLEKPTDEDDAEVAVPDELAAIGDLVWLDFDSDGIQGPDEAGLPGVVVTLYDENDMAVSVTVTDAQGNYLFENLQPGTYSIGFQPTRPGFEISPQNVGNNDAADSDANPLTGRTEPTELTPGEVDLTWDVGISGAPRMLISKDADIEVVQPNQTVIYTIVYTNTGSAQATNVTITEIVPEYSRFLPSLSNPEWSCTNGQVVAGTACTVNVGTVFPSQSNTVDLRFAVKTAQVIPKGITQLLNVVTITQDEPAGQSVAEHSVGVTQPTAIETSNEPESILTKSIYIPMLSQ